jgi:hypothetical protein
MSVETTGPTTGGTPRIGADVPRSRPRPAWVPAPGGARPARPDSRRESVRPPGRRGAVLLAPTRPRVGGGTDRPTGAGLPAAVVVRRRRAVAMVVLALVLGVLVGVLVSLAGPAAGAAAPVGAVPASTTVTVVSGGESLTEVARRVSPGAEADAVVARIRELNGLSGSGVAPGRVLVVPSDAPAP